MHRLVNIRTPALIHSHLLFQRSFLFNNILKRNSVKASAKEQMATTEGLKVAQEVAHEVEETLHVKHLDPVIGDEIPPSTEKPGESPSVWVFAFGSNMVKDVLEGRRLIKPAESVAAVLPNYMLTFNQPGLPYREPGFATIEPLESGGRPVHGVAHLMTPTEWEYYKESEGAAGQSDEGYGVIQVTLDAYDGRSLDAFTLSTQPKSLATLKGRTALPSKRYLNLLRKGAADHALKPEYQEYLNSLSHYEPIGVGGKIGNFLMGCWAFGLLFPSFALMRLYRKVMGLHTVNSTGLVSKFYARYIKFVFGATWTIERVLRPVLGCGAAGGNVLAVGGGTKKAA